MCCLYQQSSLEQKADSEQQQCIPLGFGPPANCGSLSNLTCICQEGTYVGQIALCERRGCSAGENSGQ